ncbi:hypothetical protein HHK36_016708 [Tetracentron sinense]|uniref:CCHC-type domain-containing protein n=1 Tax=Tetracentron sinense TaxID=13715 RepID=A0A834Z1T0_TETSI|nr:hypothetical protein HHK36_016708 [Tetracentron sinense]
MDPVSVATAMSVSAQVSNIPMLSGMNFKVWKEIVEIVLGCMDLDLALRSNQSIATPEKPNEKDKWSLNELISHCVQEEETQQRDKTESAHLPSTSQNEKKKRAKVTAEGSSQQKKQKKRDEEFICYFCKKLRHMKKECSKYVPGV